MTQPFISLNTSQNTSSHPVDFFDRSRKRRDAIDRSRCAESAVQAAYGCEGRAVMRRVSGSDGWMETVVTLLATVVFGLGWAAIETRSADATLQAKRAAIAQVASAGSTAEREEREIGVGAKTGYAAAGPATAPLHYGVPYSPWTDEPLARSKR